MPETVAYCPDCQEELTEDDYTHDDGCLTCGQDDIWFSEYAFGKFINDELGWEIPEDIENDLGL